MLILFVDMIARPHEYKLFWAQLCLGHAFGGCSLYKPVPSRLAGFVILKYDVAVRFAPHLFGLPLYIYMCVSVCMYACMYVYLCMYIPRLLGLHIVLYRDANIYIYVCLKSPL